MDRSFEARDLIGVMDEAKRYTRFLIDLVSSEFAGGSNIVDFGAGDGRMAAGVAGRGFSVVAMEPDPLLRKLIEARGIRSVAGLADLPAGKVEGVYSLNVLEHIEDDAAAIGQLRSLLGQNGRLLLYVPAFPVLFSSNDVRVGHYRRYRREGLTRLLREAGFTILRAEYVDSLGFVAALIYRWFGSASGDLTPRSVRFYDRIVFPISRILDRALRRVVGKNLLVTAVLPDADADADADADGEGRRSVSPGARLEQEIPCR